MVAFQCGKSQDDQFFCFAPSATCHAITADQESCTNCPAGFGPDFTFGHFPNCALPDIFLPILLAVQIAGTLLVVKEFAKLLPDLRSDVKRLAWLGILDYLSFVSVIIAIICEGGMYKGSLIMHLISFVLCAATFIQLQVFYTRPLYRTLHKSPFRMMCLLVIYISGIMIVLFGFFIHMASLAWDLEGLNRYNYYFTWATLVIGLGYFLVGGLLMIGNSRKLARLIEATSRCQDHQMNTFDKAKKRLRHLEHGLILYLTSGFVLYTGLGLTTLLLGSVPYQFIFVALSWLSSIVAGRMGINFFQTSTSRGGPVKQRCSPLSGRGKTVNSAALPDVHHQEKTTSPHKAVTMV